MWWQCFVDYNMWRRFKNNDFVSQDKEYSGALTNFVDEELKALFSEDWCQTLVKTLQEDNQTVLKEC